MSSTIPELFDPEEFVRQLKEERSSDNRWSLIATQFGALAQNTADLQKELDEARKALREVPSPGATPASRKVEAFADPGVFEGEINKFEDWWQKMRTWLMINETTIPKESWDATAAVLSRMKGPRAGTFATQRLAKGRDYTWDRLVRDIQQQFRPAAKPDWALAKLWGLKQGGMRIDDFVDQFQKLALEAGIADTHATNILEQNLDPDIRDAVVRNERRDVHNLEGYLDAVRDEGHLIETARFLRRRKLAPTASSYTSNERSSRSIFTVSDGIPPDMDHEDESTHHDIDAFDRRKPRNNRPRPSGCFNCGAEGHMQRECPKPSTKCPSCKWSKGEHKPSCPKRTQIRSVVQKDSTNEGKARAV